jgi:hypothetical protein
MENGVSSEVMNKCRSRGGRPWFAAFDGRLLFSGNVELCGSFAVAIGR